MGRASIRANLDDITGLIQQWTQARGFSCPESSTNASDHPTEPPAGPVQIKSKSVLYRAQWQCWPDAAGYIADMDVKPKFFLMAVLTSALFASLWYVVYLIGALAGEFSADDFLSLVGMAIVAVLLMWFKHFRLPVKLSRLENTFWDSVAGKHDTKRFTRAVGSTESRTSRLATQFLLSAILAYIGFLVLGILGALVLFFVCMPFLVMIVAETVCRDDSQWHWRLWIMGNVARWTFLMIAILGIAVMLSSWDIIQSLKLHKQEGPPPSVRGAILQGRFRSITPATAELLEADTRRTVNEIIDKAAMDHGGTTDKERADYRAEFELFAKILLFSASCAATVLFAAVPFHGLITSQRIWKEELGVHGELQGPFVPYLPQAWKWKTPLILQGLVVLHYVFGGIVNVAAAIFSIDGVIYALSGRTLLIERAANLWSLMFVSCKMLWGDGAGQVIGTVFVFVIAMPFLMIFATYLRRAVCRISLMARVVSPRLARNANSNPKALFIKNCVREMCSKNAVREPVVIFAKKKDIGIRLYWTALNARAVIEITDGALELLSECELRAVVAHELGHVKQGLLKVEVLKFLSSLVLFPNHYLILCLNWSSKEMHADQFALEATNDPNSLKQALIKMSTAQVSYANDSAGQETRRFSNGWLASKIRKKWLSVLTSVGFFWGDSLFGYAHPYLSERIKSIDAFAMEENGA